MSTRGSAGLARIKRAYPLWTITVGETAGGLTARRGAMVLRGASVGELEARLRERVSPRSWSRRRLAVDEGEVVRLYVQEGLSLARVAGQVSISAGSVRGILERHGVPRRRCGPVPRAASVGLGRPALGCMPQRPVAAAPQPGRPAWTFRPSAGSWTGLARPAGRRAPRHPGKRAPAVGRPADDRGDIPGRRAPRHQARMNCASRYATTSAGTGCPAMHGDGLVHSPACRPGHRVMARCPVDCLARLLPSRIAGRLARADGRRGQPVASCGVPATVGDVAGLFLRGRLGETAGLGPVSIRGIGASLAAHGLAGAADGDAIVPGCPVDCLRAVISGRALNRLARGDGREAAVATGGPPATVGDVVRFYREGRLGQIAGLGPRSLGEIEAGLVFAGLLIDVAVNGRRA